MFCKLSTPFDIGALVPSHNMAYQGYMYYGVNNKLYNSCKSPSLIREFDSEIVGMFQNDQGKMIIATRENGFFINDQNLIKSLYLHGVDNLQNINSAIYCDERIIYNYGPQVFSWSQDDNLTKKLHTGHTNNLKLAADKFNQVWLSDGTFIHKLNTYQDLSSLSIKLEPASQNPQESLSQSIIKNYPQLFPDLSFEYKNENNEWQQIKNDHIILNPEKSTISIRALSNHSKSNIFNFNIPQVQTDPISSSLKLALAIMGLLILGLMLLLWQQLYLKKISDQNIASLRTQRALAKTNDKLFELQMNPHFIFNCLNAIKGLVAIDKPKQARKAISDFASIMRSLLDYSREEENSIEEEVSFLKKYISLQAITYPNVFDFIIDVNKSVDQTTKIPVMMIQPFVENAIFHGLIPKNQKGRLSILFTSLNDILTCTIKDNGVGISDQSKSQHISQATQIIKDRIKNAKFKAELEILKLNDNEGNSIGTQINIPLVRID